MKPRNFYSLLHPRPVVLVTTLCPNERVNVAPIAWVTPVAEDVPAVALAVDRDTYTHQCIEYCREAVLNVPPPEMAELVMELGSVSGRNVDKVSRFGLRTIASTRVRPPRLSNCIGWLECRVMDSRDVGEVRLYIMEVLEYESRDDVSTVWGWDLNKVSPLLHVGGSLFATIGRRIFVKRKA